MSPIPSPPTRGALLLAFAAIYLLWGSCFLAIRIAVESIPPLLMGGARFFLAGALMYGFLRWRGAPRPSMQAVGASALLGFCFIVVANGVTAWVANQVASSYSALIWAAVPLWMVVLQSTSPSETPSSLRVKVGAGIGFLGMLMLVQPSGSAAAPPLLPTLLLLLATAAWSLASMRFRSKGKSLSTGMATALQMGIGGLLLFGLGVAGGELGALEWDRLSLRSTAAFVYLTLPGSLIPLTCYGWLLQHVAATKVATFAYVNPLVAVILGVGFAGEVLTPMMMLGGVVILAGVVLTLVEPPAVKRVGVGG